MSLDSNIIANRARAEAARILAEQAAAGLDSIIVVVDEGDDFVELKAYEPSELVEGTQMVGGFEIEYVDIIQN